MSTPLEVKNSIVINSTAAKVWDMLVNPEQTPKYMFGCRTVSDWSVGSSLLWEGEYEGNKMIFVKGNIVAIEPERFLAYTTIDPNNPSMEDVPENYLTVTYALEEANGQTTLTATQGDFSKVKDGDKRFIEVSNNGEGWNPILVQIKALCEA